MPIFMEPLIYQISVAFFMLVAVQILVPTHLLLSTANSSKMVYPVPFLMEVGAFLGIFQLFLIMGVLMACVLKQNSLVKRFMEFFTYCVVDGKVFGIPFTPLQAGIGAGIVSLIILVVVLYMAKKYVKDKKTNSKPVVPALSQVAGPLQKENSVKMNDVSSQ